MPNTEDMVKTTDEQVQVQEHAEEVINEVPKRRWQSYIWDTFNKSPEERAFLGKLDAALLTFASLGYLIKLATPSVSLPQG